MIIRNGGPFDDKQIRQVVPNGAGNTWIGFGSQAHPYPASDQQRLYKFDDTPDADAKPVEVPTRDGVRVRLTGTFYINTAFDGTPEGEKLLRAFDTSFGTRAFTGAEGAARPWEEGGWEIFLNAILQPIIDSNIREVIAEFDCKQLVSSCALVQRGGAAAVDAEEVAGSDNKSNVTRDPGPDQPEPRRGDPVQARAAVLPQHPVLARAGRAAGRAGGDRPGAERVRRGLARAGPGRAGEGRRRRQPRAPARLQRLPGVPADRRHQGAPAEPDRARRGLHVSGAMRAAFVLAVLAVILVLIVVLIVSLVAARRAARAPWALREESDGDAMKVLAVKPGQAPLLVARVPFDSEDFDGQLFEARSEGRARVSALESEELILAAEDLGDAVVREDAADRVRQQVGDATAP